MSPMNTYCNRFGAIFVGLLVCGFLSGCISLENAHSTGDTLPVSKSHKGDNPEDVWNKMVAYLKTGNIRGAVCYFSVRSKEDYKEQFESLSKTELVSYANTHKPIKFLDDRSGDMHWIEYYFDDTYNGQPVTTVVKFVKEDGQWKILEY